MGGAAAAATAAQQWWSFLPIRRSLLLELSLTLSLSGFLSLLLSVRKKGLMPLCDVWLISERYLAEDSVVCPSSPVVDPAVFLYFPLSWGSKLWQFAWSGCEAAGWQRLCSERWAAEKHAREGERETRKHTRAPTRQRRPSTATVARAAVFTSSAHPPLCISLCVTGLQAAESFSSFCPSVETWMYCWRIRSEQCIGLMQCSCVLTHSPPPRRVYCLSLSDAYTPIHSTSLPDSLFTVFFLLFLWLFLSPLTPFLSILIILFLLFLKFPFMMSCGHTLSNSFLAFSLLIYFALIFPIFWHSSSSHNLSVAYADISMASFKIF